MKTQITDLKSATKTQRGMNKRNPHLGSNSKTDVQRQRKVLKGVREKWYVNFKGAVTFQHKQLRSEDNEITSKSAERKRCLYGITYAVKMLFKNEGKIE